MIKIQKTSAPQVLIDNENLWKQNFLNAIATYNGYSNIPKDIKDKLLSHYRHKDIQDALARSSNNKCVYCECIPGESGDMEVEHFEPKALYPDLAFNWDNLLPACRKCNGSKNDHDTRNSPIINPSKEDPETILTYDYLKMIPIKGSIDETKAQNTIDVCNLNCPRLYQARADLMVVLTQYSNELKDKLDSISEATTPRMKNTRITKLSNSLEEIEKLLESSSTYSGYCKWFITQLPEYEEAKRIVNSRSMV